MFRISEGGQKEVIISPYASYPFSVLTAISDDTDFDLIFL